MASHARSGVLAARDRQNRTDDLLERLREQFPELAVADLVEAVGSAPLPDPHPSADDTPAARRETPRHRA